MGAAVEQLTATSLLCFCDQPGLATDTQGLIGPEGGPLCVACNDGDLTSSRVITHKYRPIK